MRHCMASLIPFGWACQLRNRFLREGGIPRKDKPLRGGRRRANMSLEAAVSVSDGHMDSLVLPHVNGECMQVFLDELITRIDILIC